MNRSVLRSKVWTQFCGKHREEHVVPDPAPPGYWKSLYEAFRAGEESADSLKNLEIIKSVVESTPNKPLSCEDKCLAAVKMSESGMDVTEIAVVMGVGHRTVRKYISDGKCF
jgi:DNA-binding CsgD family transcriptional regulator